MSFPTHRMRRLRRSQRFRNLVRETTLSPESMIYPIFVCPGENIRKEIGSMPGQFNLSIDNAVKVAREAESAGIGGIILFGLPKEKDEVGSDCYDENGIIQSALGAEGFTNVPIMSYAAKYASAFYGPFREAAGATPQFGDRRSYQMDPPNAREAMREIALDIEEGADIIMVKPAGPYLDIITRAREQFDLPLAAYQVSGEYAMIEAAARAGWIDRERIIMESVTPIKRAGADILITFYALELAKLL